MQMKYPDRLKRQSLHDVSITLKMWLAFLAIIFLSVIVITWISNKLSSKIIIEQTMKASHGNLLQVSERLDVAFDSMENLTKMAIADDRLQQIFDKPSSQDSFQQYKRIQALTSILNIFVEPRTDLEAMIVYDYEGQVYNPVNLMSILPIENQRLEELDHLLTQDRLQVWGNLEYGSYEKNFKKSNYFSLYRKIYSGRSGREVGIIQTTINERTIEKLYENIRIGSTGSIFIIDTEGNVLSDRNPDLINSSVSMEPYFSYVTSDNYDGEIFTLDGQPSIVVHSFYPRTGWIIVGTAPLPEILGTANRVTMQLGLLGLFAFLLSTVAAFLLSSSITQPIKELKEHMRKAGKGALGVHANVKSNDEIGVLAKEFNDMLDSITSLMDKNIKEQETIRKYELSLLQSQINPHFLNNALESSCGLIEMDKKQESIELITYIARFYRSVLSEGEPIVTLREELRNVDLYLKILNVRYGRKIEYTQEIDADLLDTMIVKLTLQPLIENSIYHGLKEKKGPWKLTLTGKKEQQGIVLNLKDNGLGMSETKIQEIFEKKPKTEGLEHHSIGIKATNERLQIHFGDQYGLSYFSLPGVGTTVIVRLPYRGGVR
jgi:two-component system sensor histidine kinase YesM